MQLERRDELIKLRKGSAVFSAAAAIVVLSVLISTLSAAQGPQAKPPKPDLHAGGPTPSAIPNGATTDVTLPGFHLAGAHVDAGPICKIESYQVASDQEIRMKIKGTRSVDHKDNACWITVRTPGGTARLWIVVDYTEEEQAAVDAKQRSDDQKNATAFQNRSGKAWRLTFAGNVHESYIATGADPDGMPTFQTSSGASVQIAVSNNNKVMIVESGCMRSGDLNGNEVKNGQSMGECKPSGAWTATVER